MKAIFLYLIVLLVPIVTKGDALNSVGGLVHGFLSAGQPARDFGGCGRAFQDKSYFTSRSGFVSFVCRNSRTDSIETLIEKLRQNGGADVITRASSGEITFEEFTTSLRYFLKFNSTIVKDFSVSSPKDWQLTSHRNDVKCSFSFEGRRGMGAELQFNGFTFAGITHFYQQQGEEPSRAKRDLQQRLVRNSPDAILLEGYEFGQPLPCEQVLQSVLTPDAEIMMENGFLLKYGFLKKIAMVPADNQTIEESDIPRFFGGDQRKAQQASAEIQFVDILHQYFVELKNGSKNALASAIQKTQGKWVNHLHWDSDKFRQKYQELNGRELSTDPQVIEKDFTPTNKFTPNRVVQNPGGTNRLVDQQDLLRNQALLQAIQITMLNHVHPMAIFGAGHLEDLADDLEKFLGAPLTTDLKNRCK